MSIKQYLSILLIALGVVSTSLVAMDEDPFDWNPHRSRSYMQELEKTMFEKNGAGAEASRALVAPTAQVDRPVVADQNEQAVQKEAKQRDEEAEEALLTPKQRKTKQDIATLYGGTPFAGTPSNPCPTVIHDLISEYGQELCMQRVLSSPEILGMSGRMPETFWHKPLGLLGGRMACLSMYQYGPLRPQGLGLTGGFYEKTELSIARITYAWRSIDIACGDGCTKKT